MSERNLNLLKGNETGFGLLIEYDGYINPNDEKNKEVLEKIKNDRTPENYGKTEFPLELYVILQKADTLNHNGRIYPYNILKKKVDLYKELILQYISGGENEHPDNANVAIDRISHRITDIWWEGKTVVGKILIYVTLGFVKYGVVSSEGDKIALLLSYGHRVGVSSRALGSVNKENDVNVVQDDLEIICWDIVSTPSTPNAWILNSKSEISNFTESKQKTNNLLESKLDKFLNILK